LGNEYPEFGGNYEVQHHSQFIDTLIKDGKLKTKQSEAGNNVTIHDPCYLGRWNNEYEAPRKVIEQAVGKAPVEMPRHKEKSFCCGAGGGQMWVEEPGERVNINRTEEAVATGADIIATACPYCNIMMQDGLKHLNKDEEIKVKDIVQLVEPA